MLNAILKFLTRCVLRALFRLELNGLEHFHAAGKRVLVVANHQSLLDPPLLWAFLPGNVTFAVHTLVASWSILKPIYALGLVEVFPMDPRNPMMTKALVQYLRGDRVAVVFPEGRITATGALMRVYEGPAMVADRADAAVLPVRIEGAQYSHFSRLQPGIKRRWLPRIRITILPACRLTTPRELNGRARRELAGRQLADVMRNMMFSSQLYRRSVFSALLDARRTHGGDHVVLEDLRRQPLDYQGLLTRVMILAGRLRGAARPDGCVGVLLPNVNSTLVTLLALQVARYVPAMLNYTAGPAAVESATRTAQIDTVVTARRFVETAGLEQLLAGLATTCQIIYLEDIAQQVGRLERLGYWLRARTAPWWWRDQPGAADRPAVILFTSGTEGLPKGVALSHANLLSNHAQVAAAIDFTSRDTVLNVLPLFHSFGLGAGALLPLTFGMRVFLYPSPLHYRAIPAIAYEINATILFGTNTFLLNYARKAHPYDFFSLRYVVAGAEKLRDETRRLWSSRFGIRILEGYGVTETSPVLSINTPLYCREGSVGRLLPGIDWQLEPVEGIPEGGRLHVRGPNIMLGYLLADQPGKIIAPRSCFGDGWHDTGDVTTVDAHGYLSIVGRAKRFAKIGGEMVSLASLELLAEQLWPDALHAAVAVLSKAKGEQLVLVTTAADATRVALVDGAQQRGLTELMVPRRVLIKTDLPLLGSGKIDYPQLIILVGEELGAMA